MGAHNKFTQEFVDAWLAEHRPNFVPAPGWVYVKALAPIPGLCRACGAECAPRFSCMKNRGQGHCRACGNRSAGEKTGARQRARGEANARREAEKRGYKILKVHSKHRAHPSRPSGFQNTTFLTLRCECGNVWDTRQSHLCSEGKGCPSCAEFGYDDSKPGAIYLLARSVDGVEQRGYGISNDWPTRIKGYERFGWLPLDVMEFSDGEAARNAENMLNRVIAATAGRSVEADNLKYRNKEAWSDGNGIPMFNSVWAFMCWAAPIDARELQDA